ncbi:hypothetical protein PhCBS80983_g03810 [Powellomyces hirtus]|uniref:BAR domain-containing protein n=1 Tax=Powellomyces hirtus TaxID=109895 RepID=A0A507E132_9FUNG|nr:hypothetical protein PhCBS80983_g03810 [Powellomyces hirtus]
MSAFQSVRRSVAAFNAHDYKELNVLIKEEKDVMTELNKFAKEKVEGIKRAVKFELSAWTKLKLITAGKYMALWGKSEHKDFEDVTEKFLTLFDEFGKFHSELIEKYEIYRSRLKDMRAREESLYTLRKRLKDLQEKYKDALKKQKPSETIKIELTVVDRDLAEQEAEHEGFKRSTFKDAMHLQMDAWMEFGNKMTVFSTFGKHLADQIPQGSLAPGQELPEYQGASVTTQITLDFFKALRSLETKTKAGAEGAPVATISRGHRDASTSSLFLEEIPAFSRRPDQQEAPLPPPPIIKAFAPHEREPSATSNLSNPETASPPHSPLIGMPSMHRPGSDMSVYSQNNATLSRYYQKPLATATTLVPPSTGYDPSSVYSHSLPRDPRLSPVAQTFSSLPREMSYGSGTALSSHMSSL